MSTFEPPTTDTRRTFDERRRAVPTATKSREFQCDTCGARCTLDPNGTTEYGHMYNCPERSDELPRGKAGGGAWYDGGET